MKEKSSVNVILLHGNSDHVGCWDWMVPHLPSDWSIVGIDLPGHGQSKLPSKFYSTMNDLYGYSVRYLVDELNWDKYHIVCHSMGTFVGSQLGCHIIEYYIVIVDTLDEVLMFISRTSRVINVT